jgi:hypothetical protein
LKNKAIIGALLAVGLLAAGCGGVDVPVEEQSNLGTRKDELPACNGEAFERVFYSDAALTNEVGWWYCYCGESTAYVYGQWQSAPYSQYTYVEQCGGW